MENPKPKAAQPALKAATGTATQVSGPRTVPGPPANADDEPVKVEAFEGVGEAPRGKNISLSRTTAANRARANLAGKLRSAGKLELDAPLPTGVTVEYEETSSVVRARARLP